MPTDPRDNFAEFRGKDGLIQKTEDGHVELTAKEKAMLGRMWGKAGTQDVEEPSVTGGIDSVTGEAWEDASERRAVLQRQDILRRTNGRGIEEV